MTALEIADTLEETYGYPTQASEMLRRQHEAIVKLREAIIGVRDQPDWHEPGTPDPWDLADQALKDTEDLK